MALFGKCTFILLLSILIVGYCQNDLINSTNNTTFIEGCRCTWKNVCLEQNSNEGCVLWILKEVCEDVLITVMPIKKNETKTI